MKVGRYISYTQLTTRCDANTSPLLEHEEPLHQSIDRYRLLAMIVVGPLQE